MAKAKDHSLKKPAQLQMAFSKAAEKHNRQIELKARYREILEDMPGWTKLTEDIEALTFKKKEILQKVSDANPKLVDELVALKVDISGDHELMADLALNNFIEEGKCEVTDDEGNTYYPVFSVKFKKQKKEEKDPEDDGDMA